LGRRRDHCGDGDGEIERARSLGDDGRFVDRLAKLLARPSEKPGGRAGNELYRYCVDGFATRMANPAWPMHAVRDGLEFMAGVF
jgi:hypothetical protein